MRERKVIGLYYYGEVTMKQIGAEIGVNESRVSQLHARAIRRLRESLGEMGPQQIAEMRKAFQAFMAPASPTPRRPWRSAGVATSAVVLPYKPAKKLAMARATLKVKHQRQAVAAAQVRGRNSRSRVRLDSLYSRLAYVRLSRTVCSRSPSRNGLASQRQPLSFRNCSASVPATSPVTKTTRLRSAGTASDSDR